MAGLLEDFSEFIKTPGGQGLLSAAFGGLAGAQRGAPLNSLGRAGMAGMMGYGGALDREKQAAEAAQMGKYRDMQQQTMQMQLEAAKRKADQDAKISAGMGQFFKPAQPALPQLMGDAESGILSSAGRAAVAPSFDAGGAAQFLAQNGEYEKSIPLLESLKPKERVLKEGDVVFSGTQKILDNPKKPEDSTDVKNFKFSEGNPAFTPWMLQGKRAGATNVSLSNVGPKAFETELGKMDAEQLGKWREGAMAAQSTLGSVQRLEDADKKGAYSGGAANLKMTVGSYINGLTGATPKGQVGSELYTAEANNLVLSQVKALGANPSNADVIFIQKTVPQLATNAEARKALTQFMREKAQGAIGLYQRANTHARKNSGLGGFEVTEPTSDIDSLVNKYNK